MELAHRPLVKMVEANYLAGICMKYYFVFEQQFTHQ